VRVERQRWKTEMAMGGAAGSWFVRAAVFRFVEETEGEENLLKLVGWQRTTLGAGEEGDDERRLEKEMARGGTGWVKGKKIVSGCPVEREQKKSMEGGGCLGCRR